MCTLCSVNKLCLFVWIMWFWVVMRSFAKLFYMLWSNVLKTQISNFLMQLLFISIIIQKMEWTFFLYFSFCLALFRCFFWFGLDSRHITKTQDGVWAYLVWLLHIHFGFRKTRSILNAFFFPGKFNSLPESENGKNG